MKFHKRTIKNIPLDNMTVLVRADYNVPLTEDGGVHDDFRIRQSLPTIRTLLQRGCKVVVIAHLGRPNGVDQSLSLEPVAKHLAGLLKQPVRFIDKTHGEKVRMAVKRAPKKSVIVLENLRFHAEEEANDLQFAQKIAKDTGAKYFIQNGFGVVHRDHASTAAMTLQLPSAAGLLLEKEYTVITTAMSHPKRPLVAVMGGAKVSDKIDVVEKFVKVADQILIGGAMANTFLAYRGFNVTGSKYETDQDETIASIYKAVEKKVGHDKVDGFLLLPTDVAVRHSSGKRVDCAIADLDGHASILDIGARTIDRYTTIAQGAGTVIWNGTLGYAEEEVFSYGSARMALALAAMHANGQTSIIGGGDTADFVLHWDSAHGKSFTHVSTGGGASMELMGGRKLPGIEHLLDA